MKDFIYKMVLASFLLISFTSLTMGSSLDSYNCVMDATLALSVGTLDNGVLGSGTSAQACVDSCALQGLSRAVISDAKYCFCGTSDLDTAPYGTCDIYCDDGSYCGGSSSDVMSVYLTPAVEGNASFTMMVQNMDELYAFGFLPMFQGVIFEVDLGFGGPLSIVDRNRLLLQAKYPIPGYFNVTVRSSSRTMVEVKELSIEVDHIPPSIEDVSCPEVSEPYESYYCDAIVTAGLNGSFVAFFSDSYVYENLTLLDDSFFYIGNPPPQGTGDDVIVASSSKDVYLRQHPVPEKGILLLIDVYVMSGESETQVSVQVNRPYCSQGEYCLQVKGCMSTCPYDREEKAMTCPSTQPFCALTQNCYVSQGTCLGPEVTPSWSSVYSDSTFVSDGFNRIDIAEQFEVFPGDVISVHGFIGRSDERGGEGDTVDGTQTDYHHYVAYTLQKGTVVQVEHVCTTINQDVMFSVLGEGTYSMMTAGTSCERNITDLELSVAQSVVDTFNPNLNMEEPYYARSSQPVELRVTFTVAGPIYIFFTFEPYMELLWLNSTDDFPAGTTPHVLSLSTNIPNNGTYMITASAGNKHNEEIGFIESLKVLVVQHEVVSSWEIVPHADNFLIPVQLPGVSFSTPSSLPFPTDAAMVLDWGDGSSDIQEFSNPPLADHIYLEGGLYDVTGTIYNEVSNVTVACQINIVEQIVGFTVSVKYLPYEYAITFNEGTGEGENEYPIMKNLTFYPSMTVGTVDRYILEHNNTEMASFEVSDPLNPTLTTFEYYYDKEVEIDITVRAINYFEDVPYHFKILIVGDVTSVRLDDYSITTKKNETKTFLVTFGSIGGSTCLIMNWGDQTMTTYGDYFTCSKDSEPDHDFDTMLDMAMNVTHMYLEDGRYTVQALAFNPTSSTIFELVIIVTSIECGPPVAEVVDGTLMPYLAPEFHRGYVAAVATATTLNCEVTSKTKKEWKMYRVDEETGETLDQITLDGILSSWNKSEILIPARFLPYGLYNLHYTITMDDPIFPPWMVFQKQLESFIRIIKTPLSAMIVEGGVSRFIRGSNQAVLFEPAKYSLDLDFPEDKNFNVTWRCRQVGEMWPVEDTPYPIDVKGDSGTGCFGHGPGYLDYYDGTLLLYGEDFIEPDKVYEMSAQVSKDTRSSEANAQVEILKVDPPVISILCVDPALCVPTSEGVVINPSLRMGVIAKCIQTCRNPLQYKWIVANSNDVPFPVNDAHFPVGDGEMELAFSSQFFVDNPNVKSIHLSVSVTDSHDAVGGAAYFMKVNQKPAGGTCRVTGPETSHALIDVFKLICSGWVDPENAGIKSYLVTLMPHDGPEKTLTEMTHSSQMQPKTLVLPPGTFDFKVKVKDVWGAFNEKVFQTGFEVLMPTKEEYDNSSLNSFIDALRGEGNGELLNMVFAAQSAFNAKAEWMSLDPAKVANMSTEEKESRMVELANQMNNALDGLQENVNMKNMESLDVTSSTIATIMEGASSSSDAAKTVDLNARQKVLDLSNNLISSLETMPVSSPEEMKTVGTNLLTVLGGVAKGTQSLGDEKVGCDSVSPADMKKIETMEYDTGVTGIDMEVEEDILEAQKCNIRENSIKQAQSEAPKVENMMSGLAKNILKKSVVGENLTLESPNGVVLSMAMKKGDELSSGSLSVGGNGAKFDFPTGFCPQGDCSTPVATTAKEWPSLTNTYTSGAKDLSPESRVLDLELFDRNLGAIETKDLKEPIRLVLTRNVGSESSLPAFEYINATIDSPKLHIPIMYSTFTIPKEGLSVNLEISPVDPDNHNLFVMVSTPKLPTLKEHLFFTMVRDIPTRRGDTYDWFFSSRDINETGQYFVGVGEFKSDFEVDKMQDPWGHNVTSNVLKNITVDYALRVFTSGCYYFNKTLNDWVNDGLEVVFSSFNVTECNTTHLTSFGSGMFVMPNTIDFSYVFANLGFNDNLTIYLTLIVSLSVCLLLMVWARIKDKQDISELGATPFPDNKVEDKYLYEVLVFTGSKTEAQTDSVVQFVLTGEEDETEIRTFGDDSRKIFRKGGVDVFVLAVARPLGALEFLRIWHDNSGKGPNASWYLSYIVFRDVQTGQKFEFIANEWFAVESYDGQIDRLLSIAGQEQKTNFKHLFNTTKNKNLADGHLWFSVFLRPPRSRFTRCQRVASCFALLFLSMLANAMWYEQVPDQPGSGGLQLGPFSLSPEQLGVGFMSNLIVFPPSILIVLLFRKARPRRLRKSRVQEAVEKTRLKHGITEESEESKRSASAEVRRKRERQKKKKFTLPWWTVLIAWALVLTCIIVSVFFLLMYGVMFGNAKVTKWVTSLVVSFFSSILFVQPLKIFMTAMVVSALFKNVNLDEDDADEDEEDPELEDDEMWLHKAEDSEERPKVREKRPKINDEVLRSIREHRRKEMEMYEILKEIFAYMMFLWLLMTLSYGNRDPNAFLLQQSLNQGFVHKGMLDGSDYTKVTNTDRLWRYLHVGLLPFLRADRLYNGSPPYGLRGFLGDQCNRIMGYATIRQVRIKENTCKVNKKMRNFIKRCSGYSNIVKEDDKAYCANWKLPTNNTQDTADCEIPEFSHTRGLDLNTLPLVGSLDAYGPGGYVIHMNESTKKIHERLNFLQSKGWIDRLTRFVVVEFASYNAQVNLFGLSHIKAEYTPGGGITPTFKFTGIRLLPHHDGFGLFIIICECSFVAFVLYYTVREFRMMCKDKRKYFDCYWSYAEIAIIICSYAAIVVYGLRHLATSSVINVFNETHGNGYVNLQYASSLDELFGYLVSFVVFVGTLKFAKLLRFNKRMGILSATLRQCWDELSGFLIAFVLSFCSFTAMFYLLLNSNMANFHNFVSAVETCFSMMLGKFQFEEMKQVSSVVPVMFFIFVLCNSWVLINLLLTVIITTFEQVKKDIINQPSDYQMVAFIWGRFAGFLGFGKPPQPPQIPVATPPSPKIEKYDEKVKELPEKINRFVEYLNETYFDGSLDLKNKDILKSSYTRHRRSAWSSRSQSRSVVSRETDRVQSAFDKTNSKQDLFGDF